MKRLNHWTEHASADILRIFVRLFSAFQKISFFVLHVHVFGGQNICRKVSYGSRKKSPQALASCYCYFDAIGLKRTSRNQIIAQPSIKPSVLFFLCITDDHF